MHFSDYYAVSASLTPNIALDKHLFQDDTALILLQIFVVSDLHWYIMISC